MGLIKALVGAAGGAMADQWKEFFYCDSIDNDVLAVKGKKRITSRSSNTSGNDNIISNGSGIAVADGQCMIIVEQGKVVDICAEPGQYTYDKSTEPSVFTGGLKQGIKDTFKLIGKRFTYGGDTGKDQRVYYFNTKEIIDNKFGTATPIPFRVVDTNANLDIDVSVRCNGVYSYVISNPILFYTKLCGNIQTEYRRDTIDNQLKSEFIQALQPAFAQISATGVRPSALPGYVGQLADEMNNILTTKWGEMRGISVASIALNAVNLSEEDTKTIQNAQRMAMLRDPGMAAAKLADAQAEAMMAAANNTGGAMSGFMGFGMAQQAGGLNAAELYAMSSARNSAQQNAAPIAPTGGWKCSCGVVATGNFCPECGSKKPEDGWKCTCGSVNKGNFCTNCGAKRPSGSPLYRCDKCGWTPEDPHNPPKFCPECGDAFTDADRQ